MNNKINVTLIYELWPKCSRQYLIPSKTMIIKNRRRIKMKKKMKTCENQSIKRKKRDSKWFLYLWKRGEKHERYGN